MEFVIASTFFVILIGPVISYMLGGSSAKTFDWVVLYHPKCEISSRLLKVHEDNPRIRFVDVSVVPMDMIPIANTQERSDMFGSGSHVIPGTASAKAASEYILSLTAQYGFDSVIPITVPVCHGTPMKNAAVSGYPNVFLH